MLIQVAILLTILLGVQSMSSKVLINIIESSCKEENGICPKEEFGIFSENGWEWNRDAIIQASETRMIRQMTRPLREVVPIIKSIYCCEQGACLTKCGKENPIEEIELIKQFPSNAKKLLSLKFKPIEIHKANVIQWLEDYENGMEKDGNYPAEIEDFFDILHQHQDTIQRLLKENRITRLIT